MTTISLEQFKKLAGGATITSSTNTNMNEQLPKDQTQSQALQSYLSERNTAITNALQKRNMNISETINQAKSGQIGVPQEALNITGQAIGGAFDIASNIPVIKEGLDIIGKGIGGLASIIPKPTKGSIADVVTPKILNWYNSLSSEQQKSVNAVGNIVALLPAERAVSTGIKAGSKIVGGTIKATTEVAKPVTSTIGRTLKTAGEKAYGISVPMEESTRIAKQAYEATQPSFIERVSNFAKGIPEKGKPITEANTAARHGLAGTEWKLGVQAERISNSIWNTNIKPKLQAITGRIDLDKFWNEVQSRIVNSNPELSRRNAILDGLNSLREDYSKIGSVTLEKLQDLKSGWARQLPERTFKGKEIGSAFKEATKNAADVARDIIYDQLGPEAKMAYLDYGNLQSIAEAGRKSIDLLRSKSWSRQAWEFLLDKAVTPVTTIGGKVLYKTGSGLEFIGNAGAKKVKDVLLLPAPSIKLGPGGKDSFKTLPAEKISIKNPKTGRYERAYTSNPKK